MADIRDIALAEDTQLSPEVLPHDAPTAPSLPAEGQIANPEKVPLQPPVKKASSIIGKAIAKAMARETSVKESSLRDGSPPIYSTEESSRGSTPASLSRDLTSSFVESEESGNSFSGTPASTPDIDEGGAPGGELFILKQHKKCCRYSKRV